MSYKVNIIYKKVKNLTLRIKQDGTVNLTVPFGISEDEAMKFVIRKEKWIEDKLSKIEKIEKVNLVDGDIIHYLGKPYFLKIIKSSVGNLLLKGEYIEIYVDNVDDFHEKSKVLNNWYLSNAKEVYTASIAKWEKILGVGVTSLSIKYMKTRWGSCNTRLHRVNLNLELIKRDEKCIDYVVLHEISHITHPNHSKDFWRYVETYMKDYREVRASLKEKI